jgi:hypothetical protein
MVGLDSAGKTTILYRLQVSLSTTLCKKRAENRLEKSFLLSQVCHPLYVEPDMKNKMGRRADLQQSDSMSRLFPTRISISRYGI